MLMVNVKGMLRLQWLGAITLRWGRGTGMLRGTKIAIRNWLATWDTETNRR